MRAWEVFVFQAIYGLHDSLFPIFYIVTQLGSIYILGILLALYMIKRSYHILLHVVMNGTLAYLMAGFMKDIWGRARPDELLAGVVHLDYARGAGFPSGHMALAVALALTVGHYVPKKYHWLIAVWILGVGLSRIYLGVHAPLDIIGGFAIGWGSYALFRHVKLYDIHRRSKSDKLTTKTTGKNFQRNGSKKPRVNQRKLRTS